MTLGIATPVAVTSSITVAAPRICKVATDVAVVAYDDGTNSEVRGKVCNIATGSIVLGTAQTLFAGAINSDDLAIWQTISNQFALVYGKSGLNGSEATGVIRSGDTLTPGTPNEFVAISPSVSPALGIGTTGTVGLILYMDNGSTEQYCRLAIAGSTITPGTPEAPSDTNLTTPLGIVGMDADDVMVMYADSSRNIEFQMVNLSTGISQGAISDSTHDLPVGFNDTNMRNYCLARLSNTKAIACFPRDDTTDALSLMTINRSGTTITSFGTALDIYTGTALYGAIGVISDTKIILFYRDGAGDEKVQTFTISGDVITADGNTATLTTTWGVMGGVVVLDSDEAVICWEDGSGDIQTALVTGFIDYGLTHSAGGIPGAILVTS